MKRKRVGEVLIIQNRHHSEQIGIDKSKSRKERLKFYFFIQNHISPDKIKEFVTLPHNTYTGKSYLNQQYGIYQ